MNVFTDKAAFIALFIGIVTVITGTTIPNTLHAQNAPSAATIQHQILQPSMQQRLEKMDNTVNTLAKRLAKLEAENAQLRNQISNAPQNSQSIQNSLGSPNNTIKYGINNGSDNTNKRHSLIIPPEIKTARPTASYKNHLDITPTSSASKASNKAHFKLAPSSSNASVNKKSTGNNRPLSILPPTLTPQARTPQQASITKRSPSFITSPHDSQHSLPASMRNKPTTSRNIYQPTTPKKEQPIESDVVSTTRPITPNATQKPSTIAVSTSSPTDKPLNKRSPIEQYDDAFSLIKEGNYEQAEKEFARFIENNSDHKLAGNAYYWMGETFYARAQFMKASVQFVRGYNRFPNGRKAPDNLLKLGMSLARLDKNNEACTTFRKLKTDFPKRSAAITKRMDNQLEKLSCPQS